MLRVAGNTCKCKVFSREILQVLHVLAVFGLCVLRDTASIRSISRSCTANTPRRAEFWGPILWNTAVLEALLLGFPPQHPKLTFFNPCRIAVPFWGQSPCLALECICPQNGTADLRQHVVAGTLCISFITISDVWHRETWFTVRDQKGRAHDPKVSE